MRLELKLALLVALLLVTLLAGLGLSLGGSLSGWSQDAVDAELSRRVERIRHELHFEHGELELDDDDEEGFSTPGAFRLEDPSGRVWRSSGEWPPAALAVTGLGTVEVRGTPTRVLARQLDTEAGVLVVRVASSLRAVEGVTGRLQAGLGWAVGIAAALGGLGALLLARWFLRPLQRLTSEVDALEARTLSGGLSTSGLDPALARLAGAFNGLLARVAVVHEGQRNFVARASHALRTPLAGVLTTAEVALRRDRSEAEYREALANIVGATQEAVRVTSGLLALMRAEAAAAAQPEDVELAQVFDELERLFRPRLEVAGLRLHRSAAPGLGVRVTRARLREALDALLDNAVRYTPRGGELFLSAERSGSAVVVTVADTGPGVPEAERTQIFERFVRGTVGERSGEPGSGLGLAVARALVEADGGTLRAESRGGGGACFVAEFPAPAEPVAAT